MVDWLNKHNQPNKHNQRHLILTELNKRFYTVPQQWNDLTGKQLLEVMFVLQRSPLDLVAMLQLLKIIIGVGWLRWFTIPAWQKLDALYLTDFLLLKNTLTKNVLPVYRGFHGPADDFSNMTGDEFVYSEEYFMKWQADKRNMGLLNDLVAVLYRPIVVGYNLAINEAGDPRIPFNENRCAYEASKTVVKWPLMVKQSIAHWYEACREKLVQDFEEVFNGGDGEAAKYGLLSVYIDIGDAGTFGPFQEVGRQYIRLLLVKMEKQIEEAKAAEKNAK